MRQPLGAVYNGEKFLTYNIGVAIDLAAGDFQRTKIVRLAPLFEIHNETDEVYGQIPLA